MKRISLFITLILLSYHAFSQEENPTHLLGFDLKRLHFGITAGLNTMDLAIKRNFDANDFIYADMSRIQPGFQVSIVSDLRLSGNWNLRFLPGISFGSREVNFYEYTGSGQSEIVKIADANVTLALGPSFLDFPLHFKYRSERANNHRPYVIGGLNFKYDISAQREYEYEPKNFLKFKPADFYLEFGFGVDAYLKGFVFAPEIKLAVGLRNILADEGREPYVQFMESIDRVNSYIVMLSFHFE